MIQYLQKLKKSRGFTLIELIVVIALIAVLSAVILTSTRDDSKERTAANSRAQDFYTCVQYNYMVYEKYEHALSVDIDADPTAQIKYYPELNGNFPTIDFTFIEMCIDNGVIQYVHTAADLETLVNDTREDTAPTPYETRLMDDFKVTIDSGTDGFYYALVEKRNSSTGAFDYTTLVKVHSAYYSPERLPLKTAASDAYREGELLFVDDAKLANHQIMGACTDYKSGGYYIGTPGSYFMGMTSSLDVLVET